MLVSQGLILSDAIIWLHHILYMSRLNVLINSTHFEQAGLIKVVTLLNDSNWWKIPAEIEPRIFITPTFGSIQHLTIDEGRVAQCYNCFILWFLLQFICGTWNLIAPALLAKFLATLACTYTYFHVFFYSECETTFVCPHIKVASN